MKAATKKPAVPLVPAGPSLQFKPLESLKIYERNARVHDAEQIDALQTSMLEFGWTMPVLEDSHGVVAGAGRIAAAQRLYQAGATLAFPDGTPIPAGCVPVLSCEGWSEAKRRAYVVADNQLALNSTWNEDLLRGELEWLEDDGFDLSLLGFDASELDALFKPAHGAGYRDPDAVPSTPRKVHSKAGDVWVLGAHRVVCGDATAISTWQALLLRGELLDCVWTDPPYNVAYSSGLAGSIKNDDLRDRAFRSFLRSVFSNLERSMKPGASIYVAHADTEGLNFRRAFVGAGFKLSGCLIWRKDSLVLGRSPYQWAHEPILYGWKPGAAHRWYGDRKETTVQALGEGSPFTQQEDGSWSIRVGDDLYAVAGAAVLRELQGTLVRCPKPRRSAEHPTMKPVALIERQLGLSARKGQVVGDACGGSGSTLIAAERLGMAARLVELEPRFVDVIVMRWQNYTGLVAVREADQVPFPVVPDPVPTAS